jgi:serine/threonine-protein kinase
VSADDKKTRIGTPAPQGVRAGTGQPYTGTPGLGVPIPPAGTQPPPGSGPNVQISPSAMIPQQQPMQITQAPIAPAPQPGATQYMNVPAAGAPAYVAPADPLLGQVLAGRYLVQKKLGEGGMGAVYLATHTVLEKQVALKVLHGEFARKPDLVERFMQEAKAASRIRHENVIDISDFGQAGEGIVFFAMELLNGHDLHEEIARARLAGRRLPWERTRPIFLQICSALSAAHAMGVVHRDLKPENIYLVEWLGHKDFVKLLDFGIAKLTEVSDGDRKLTRTGMLFGTPEYMSPEQARGEPVDHRVDIYAMGCILYQLVTGRVPFEAENFMGILSLHLTEEPPMIPPPIFQEIGAPPQVEQIIRHALAKDRDQRFLTVDDMANAIRSLHGEQERPVMQPRVPLATSPVRAQTGGSTGQVPAVGAYSTTAPGPARTQWTGSLQVPHEDVPAPKKSSKAPWIVIAVLAAGGGGAAAFMATHKSSSTDSAGGSASSAGTGTGTAATGTGAGTAGTPVVTPDAAPQPPPEQPLPARVTLSLDSDPQGADIYDTTTKETVGQTPFDFEVPGSRDPRRYTFKLKGYAGKMIELVPSENVQYKAELTKLAKGQKASEPQAVEVVPQKKRPHGGDHPQTMPGTGTGSAPGSGTGSAPGSDVGPQTHPGSGETHPGSGETHPGSGETHPGSGETHPGSGETHPGSGEPHPGSGETHPGSGTAGSGTDDDLPGLKQFPPPGQ